jgi:ring-1,2-phenylacetyl-CoA epoxidase subunit PaaE
MNMDMGIFKKLKIREIKEEIKGFKTIIFEDNELISYKPGQYITLVDQQPNEEIRRSYSISSTPALNEPLSIGIKRIENGYFSRMLVDKAKVGDELLTIGSGGFFILPDNILDYQQIVFLAAGSGITPVYSLLKSVLFEHPNIKVLLIYSNPSPEKTVWHNELQKLAKEYEHRFVLELIFSNTPDLTRAHLYRELLLEFLFAYNIRNFNQTLFYICGPEVYMRMCTYVLQEEGVPKDNIKKENFIIQRREPSMKLPPDTENHQVCIKLAQNNYRFVVNYPDSILKAAKKQGIQLPYSCETGRCGNCAALCVQGKVWLSYNEVLTEKDLAFGLTLTCVGHPIGGDVSLLIK